MFIVNKVTAESNHNFCFVHMVHTYQGCTGQPFFASGRGGAGQRKKILGGGRVGQGENARGGAGPGNS